MLKNCLYTFTCLSLAVVIGGAIYEHLAVIPKWSAAPPVSLTMFQGQYGLNPGAFWTLIHPVTVLLLMTTLIAHWNTSRKRSILISFIGYVIVIAVTAIYFVPELISILTTPISQAIDPALTERAQLWEALSLVRLVFMVVLAISLFLGLTKSAQYIR